MRISHLLSGFAGFALAALLAVGLFEWKIAPAVQHMHDIAISSLAKAMSDDAACQAKFNRATLLYDLSNVPSAREPRQMRTLDNGVQILGGIIELAPGRAIRDGLSAGAQRREHPRAAWYIPADVEPVFYGDPADALVMHFNPMTRQISDTPHPPSRSARLDHP